MTFCRKYGFVATVVLSLLCCVSCASLGDPGKARRKQSAELQEVLAARSAWLSSPRTLEECLSFALENNYTLRLAALQRRLAELDVNASISNFLPQVQLKGSWTEWRHQQTMMGELAADKDYMSAGLSGQMPIFYPATWLLYANRKLERQSSVLTEHVARQSIVAQVTVLYYQCLLGELEIQALQSQVASSKSEFERIASMKEEEQVLEWECSRAEAHYRSREISLRNAIRSLVVTRGQLLQALGLSPLDAEKLQLVYPQAPRVTQEGEVADRVLTALMQRPELSIQDRKTVEAENAVRMAIVDFLPKLGGFLNGTWTSDDIADRASNVYGGFTGTMDLFQGFAKVTGYKSAKVGKEAALLQREDMFLAIMLEVLSADRDLRNAVDAQALAQLNYDTDAARYNEFRTRYEEGIEPLYEMLDAQAEMDNAKLVLVHTTFLADIAQTNLELAMGVINPDDAHWTPEDAEHPMKDKLDELLIKAE